MRILLLFAITRALHASSCDGSHGPYECTQEELCCDPEDFTCMFSTMRNSPRCNYDGCSNVAIIHPISGASQVWQGSCKSTYCHRTEPFTDFTIGLGMFEACPAKYVCPPGSYALNHTCIPCTAGHYCPGDGYFPHACTPCSAGQIMWDNCTSKHNFVCDACPLGSRPGITPCECRSGYRSTANGCVLCAAGRESVHNSTECTQCAQGNAALPGENCSYCPPGFYCPNGESREVCPAGVYCKGGTIAECPMGKNCFFDSMHDSFSLYTIPCYYQNSYCPAGSSDMQECPAGYYCNFGNATICPAGSYCLPGAVKPWKCSDLFYCPEGTTVYNAQCPAGYYCTNVTTKVICPLGFHCPTGSNAPQPCEPLHYCPVGSKTQPQCPEGFFCADTSTIAKCTTGYYCPNGSTTPTICALGQFCPEGSIVPSGCEEGFFCPNTRTKTPCPAGMYCEISNYQYCVEGSYCPEGSVTELDCPPGWMCPETTYKLICRAGTYCLARSLSNDLICVIGSYCPPGSTLELDCPAGYVCPNTTHKTVCPAGSYCPLRSVNATLCEPNQMCAAGSKEPVSCPVNYYCPKFNEPPVLCIGSNVCVANTVAPIVQPQQPCPPGFVPHHDLVFATAVRQNQNYIYQYDKIKMISLDTGRVQVIQTLDDIFENQKRSVSIADSIGFPIVMSHDISTMYAFSYYARGVDTVVSELWAVNMSTAKPYMVAPMRTASNSSMSVQAACMGPEGTLLILSMHGLYTVNLQTKELTYVFGDYVYFGVKYMAASERLLVIVDDNMIRVMDSKTHVNSIQKYTGVDSIAAAQVDFHSNMIYFSPGANLFAMDLTTAVITQLGTPDSSFAIQQITLKNGDLGVFGLNGTTPQYRIFSAGAYSLSVNTDYNLVDISQPNARLCSACESNLTGIVFTHACDYKCAYGHVRKDGLCVNCSRLNCTTGMHTGPCNETSDSQCVDCDPVENMSNWTGPTCNFACNEGFFRNGSVCSPCDNPQCSPGAHQTQCNPMNRRCTSCPVPYGPAEFTAGCEFTCKNETYKTGQYCMPCSVGVCAPGSHRTQCQPLKNTECTACARPFGSYTWTSECEFQCRMGSYLMASMFCALCSAPSCTPGYYASNCTSTENSECMPCEAPLGDFQWITACEYARIDTTTTTLILSSDVLSTQPMSTQPLTSRSISTQPITLNMITTQATTSNIITTPPYQVTSHQISSTVKPATTTPKIIAIKSTTAKSTSDSSNGMIIGLAAAAAVVVVGVCFLIMFRAAKTTPRANMLSQVKLL